MPPESARWRRFVDHFEVLVTSADYGLIIPPLLEDVGVFQRAGEATDAVGKEMYDFVDKGARHIALRPEQTASVCRAFVQNRPITPWKVWYSGPNFRYEKPQRGRFRQFDQVGIEVLGVDDPTLDAEVIALGWKFFQTLGLKNIVLQINSLGDPSDRQRYVDALKLYFTFHNEKLSAESRETLQRNPLRVLDSKRTEDQEIISLAPKIAEFYGNSATLHFEAVKKGLDALNIPFIVNDKLVRGLDYYLKTTFEYVGGTLDSAQNALGGGGRYDGLVENLGGPNTPGVGLAIGLDRTLIACDDEGVFAAEIDPVTVFVVDTTGGHEALLVTNELRNAGLSADRAYENRSMKSQMKVADRSGARIAIIIGQDELAAGTCIMRLLRVEAEQTTLSRQEIVTSIMKALS